MRKREGSLTFLLIYLIQLKLSGRCEKTGCLNRMTRPVLGLFPCLCPPTERKILMVSFWVSAHESSVEYLEETGSALKSISARRDGLPAKGGA